jgi:hypothetical protein
VQINVLSVLVLCDMRRLVLTVPIEFVTPSFLGANTTSPRHALYRLLQRYQNVKAELEAQQNLERIRMEKLAQSGGLTSMSGTKKGKTGGSGKRTASA